MPNPDVVRAAVSVGATAAVVAVVFGLPTLLSILGVHVDYAIVANMLAALAAFAAAAVALWIATRDRQERKREREAGDFAQAKLVSLLTHHHTDGTRRIVRIEVDNSGTRAIVDVTFIRLEIENHENLDPRPSTNPILAAVRPAQPGAVYWFLPSDNPDDPVTLAFFGREVPGDPYHELQVQPTVTPGTKFTATVQFTDVNGNVWQKSGVSFSGRDVGASARQGQPVRLR